MALFQRVFPQLIQSCATLHSAFLPWLLVLLVLSFAFEYSRGVELRGMLLHLLRIFTILLITLQSHEIINVSQVVVEHFVETTGLVRPEKLAQDYKDRLADTLGEPELKSQSAIRLLLNGHVLDAALYAGLLAWSYLCLGLITSVTLVKNMVLCAYWAVCPILFGCLAIPPLAHLGSAHVRRLFAVTLWPIGLCVASTLSDGLIQMALDDRVLAAGSAGLTLAASIESLIILSFAGGCDAVATILTPAITHRFLVGTSGPGQLISSAGAWAYTAGLPSAARATRSTVTFLRERLSSPVTSRSSAEPFSVSPPPPPPSASVAPAVSATLSDPTGAKELNELLERS